MMMLLKGVFASLAGPAPNYDMQENPEHKKSKRSQQDDRFCKYYSVAHPLYDGDWIDDSCIALL